MMELIKKEEIRRTLKIYLNKHIHVDDNLNYRVEETILPKEIVDHVVNMHGLPIVYLKRGVEISNGIAASSQHKSLCIRIHHDKNNIPGNSTLIPLDLIKKMETRIYTIFTPYPAVIS